MREPKASRKLSLTGGICRIRRRRREKPAAENRDLLASEKRLPAIRQTAAQQ